jgi:MoCo/4Fe-4S cofactor protein with predicted Tat translocation signal
VSPLDASPDAPRSFWRSLDERAGTPEFRAFVEREFPAWADEMLEPASRRRFLKLMGASMAFAGMTACRWPVEPIVPFAHHPAGYVPGEPLHYATAIELLGAAVGLVVTSYDGRPIKVEGNPDHAYSLGGTLAWHQAALLELYDPDRSQHVVARDGAPASWDAFAAFVRQQFDALRASGGRGLAVLAEPSSSPSRRAQQERFHAAFPHARWHEYEPLSRDNAREGARLAFGAPHRTHLALDRAETIVALDEDFLLHHPAAVRYARDFVAGRDPGGTFSRLWVVETNLSLTGSVADRRITLAHRALPAFATCLLAKLVGEAGVALPAALAPLAPALEAARSHPLYARVDSDLVLDLASKHGRTAILAGPGLTPEAHAVVHALNAALGNVGRTVTYTVEADPDRPHHGVAIRDLARDMGRNLVETLVILGGNPVYDAPADLGFADLLPRVKSSIRLAAYADETSRVSSWHLPRAHALESWGDARDFGGTLCLVQPLIEPLHGGRSDLELLEMLLGVDSVAGHDIVRRTFGGDDRAWHAALRAGVVDGSAAPLSQPVLGSAAWAERVRAALGPPSAPPAGSYEVVFAPDASLLDGRFANNGWLQELADPLTKLTWDNAATVAPETAVELHVEQGDVVRLVRGGASVELPVFLLPGQAPRTIGATLGYGRTRAGHVGTGAGVDVYALRVGEEGAWADVQVERTGRTYRLATTQDHFAIDRLGARERGERAVELVREVDVAELRHAGAEHAAAAAHAAAAQPLELWTPPLAYDGERWGMAIDLNACTGCGACVVACQAENNIPVVGKDEVARGREMHWIRIDRYFAGEPAAPEVVHQPVTCHHCENAPCEQVCPVAATVHDAEGLNVMVYNRCIGTRYCNNNCPYKVRRFNWFNNHKSESALEVLVYNPEVTVRSRGVMEKCTYCVQRIQRVRIRARNEQVRGENGRATGRMIRDGEIVPACAQACPTRAIAFGDLNDPESRVGRQHASPRAYKMLAEFNVRPRTAYLARVRNRGGSTGTS